MGDILDSRPRERCTSFDHLPTQATKPHTRFNCARLAAAISGSYCLMRRRAERDPGCEACAIGAQHEAIFGKELNARQTPHPSPIMRPASLPAPIPCEAGSNKTTVRSEEMPPDDMKLELTVQEAAEVSGLCRNTLLTYCRNGAIQARKATTGTSRGKDAWLINRESLHQLMQDPPRRGRSLKARVAPHEKAAESIREASEDSPRATTKQKTLTTNDIITRIPQAPTMEGVCAALLKADSDLRVLKDEFGQVLLSKNYDIFLEVTPGLKNLLAAIIGGQVDAGELAAKMEA